MFLLLTPLELYLELHTDLLIRTHLALLYDTLLEQNLVRVIEPYSVVELSYVANQVGQPLNSVESKYVRVCLRICPF